MKPIQSIGTEDTQARPEVARQYFLQFLQYRQAFVDERHPNLWGNLYSGYKQVNLNLIKAGFEQKSHLIGGVYSVLNSQPNLLTEINFKKIQLESILPVGMASFYVDTLKRAMKVEGEYSLDWTTPAYDYTITLKHQSGFYKAWLHEYWPGTANGNVWLIINPTTAVFYLVD